MAMAAPEANRRTFRFKPAHDVILLKEVARVRPWAAPHGETLASWESIGASFNEQLAVIRPHGTEIDPKACQRRYKALIDSFLSGDLASLRSTGSVEEVTEREKLISDLHHVAKEYRSERGERRQSRGYSSVSGDPQGSPVGDAALALTSSSFGQEQGVAGAKRELEPNGSALAAKKQRTLLPAPRGVKVGSPAAVGQHAWEFLQRHLESESAQRRQELLLAEQRLELDKQRFELEKRERESHISTMSAQLELIQQLVAQLQQRSC